MMPVLLDASKARNASSSVSHNLPFPQVSHKNQALSVYQDLVSNDASCPRLYNVVGCMHATLLLFFVSIYFAVDVRLCCSPCNCKLSAGKEEEAHCS